MREKNINFLKEKMGFDDDQKINFVNLPMALKKYIGFFLLVSIGMFAICTAGTIVGKDMLWGMGYLISLSFALYALYLYFYFSYQKYELIVGRCVELSINPIRRDRCTVYMKDKEGITFSFLLINRKGLHIREGDIVNVYACNKLSVYEKEGEFIISQYYSAVKAPIKDQVT